MPASSHFKTSEEQRRGGHKTLLIHDNSFKKTFEFFHKTFGLASVQLSASTHHPVLLRVRSTNSLSRNYCRAKAAALRVGSAGDGHGVPAGSFVDVHVADVPQADAEAILNRVNAAAKVKSPQVVCLKPGLWDAFPHSTLLHNVAIMFES